jgi:hypothetical protein
MDSQRMANGPWRGKAGMVRVKCDVLVPDDELASAGNGLSSGVKVIEDVRVLRGVENYRRAGDSGGIDQP